MNIPAWLWFLVGLAVTIVSVIQEDMILFIVVGVVFMGIGIAKYITGRSKRDAPSSKPPKNKAIKNYIKCVHCHAWNYPHVAICHHCRKEPRH